MTVFLIRRLLQTIAVLLAVSLVVFIGLYAVGNPIDILMPTIPPLRNARLRSALWASTARSGCNTASF
jgi:peptide/nickel transport system permease protein